MELHCLPIPMGTEERISELLPLLPLSSHARILEKKRQGDRLARLCTELLLRRAACAVCGEEILCATLAHDAHGKPYFPDFPALCISVSHTEGCAAVCISDVPVGVDIEKLQSARPDVAQRFFTPEESAWILAQDDDPSTARRNERFFTVWTRKEAFGKFCGVGLAYPTRTTDVLRDTEQRCFVTRIVGDFVLSVCSGCTPQEMSVMTCTDWRITEMAEILPCGSRIF